MNLSVVDIEGRRGKFGHELHETSIAFAAPYKQSLFSRIAGQRLLQAHPSSEVDSPPQAVQAVAEHGQVGVNDP